LGAYRARGPGREGQGPCPRNRNGRPPGGAKRGHVGLMPGNMLCGVGFLASSGGGWGLGWVLGGVVGVGVWLFEACPRACDWCGVVGAAWTVPGG